MSNPVDARIQAVPSSSPRVCVIILNWNSWQDTVRSIVSVFESDYPHFDLLIMDNGSHDDSVLKIAAWLVEHFGETDLCTTTEVKYVKINAQQKDIALTYLVSDQNLGFSGGCNWAVKFAFRNSKPDYFFFLNNDALIDKGCISKCLESGERGAAIVGSLIKSIDGKYFLFVGA